MEQSCSRWTFYLLIKLPHYVLWDCYILFFKLCDWKYSSDRGPHVVHQGPNPYLSPSPLRFSHQNFVTAHYFTIRFTGRSHLKTKPKKISENIIRWWGLHTVHLNRQLLNNDTFPKYHVITVTETNKKCCLHRKEAMHNNLLVMVWDSNLCYTITYNLLKWF